MKTIVYDPKFYIAIIFIIAGVIVFKAVDRSFNKQKQRLEDPQKNFEKLQREMLEKGVPVGGHTWIGLLAPAFIMVMGIIMLIVLLIEHLN